MEFTKMHGLGNDFVFIEESVLSGSVDIGQLAIKICDRHFGIGADGLVVIGPSAVADMKMRIFNADGSEPEMCGNAVRCVGKYLFERGIISGRKIGVETQAGIIRPEIMKVVAGKAVSVKVDMGPARFSPREIPVKMDGDAVVEVPLKINGSEWLITCVSMGNPHCIIFVKDVDNAPVDDVGPVISSDRVFPNKTNVEFVQIVDKGRIRVRVWERGVGETLACGTGACASAVAAAVTGRCGRAVRVQLAGGELETEWDTDDHVLMTGPAEEVFSGSLKDIGGK